MYLNISCPLIWLEAVKHAKINIHFVFQFAIFRMECIKFSFYLWLKWSIIVYHSFDRGCNKQKKMTNSISKLQKQKIRYKLSYNVIIHNEKYANVSMCSDYSNGNTWGKVIHVPTIPMVINYDIYRRIIDVKPSGGSNSEQKVAITNAQNEFYRLYSVSTIKSSWTKLFSFK